MTANPFVQSIIHHILSGCSVLRVDTDEERRAMQEIGQVGWILANNRKVGLGDKESYRLGKLLKQAGAAHRAMLNDQELHINSDLLAEMSGSLLADDVKFLEEIVSRVGYRTITWDVNRGFSDVDVGSDQSYAESPRAALASIPTKRFQGNVLFVFKDVAPYLGQQADDPTVRRMLRDLVEMEALTHIDDEHPQNSFRRPILFLSPTWTPHRDIAHYFVHVDFPLPDEQQIEQEVLYSEESITNKSRPEAKCPPEMRHQLRRTLRGLTAYEIVNTIGYAVVKHQGFTPDMLKTVQKLKAQTFEREEALSWVDPDNIPPIERFAGFGNYLDWLGEVKGAYTPEAAAAGIKPDKGALLCGIPGTGKSQIGMATARFLDLPLIKFDFSSIFGQYVGQSEESMRRVLRRVNAEGECVLFIDEADKAFSNVTGPHAGSNVEQHVFGQLITWMANDNKGAFVIMTMNRPQNVPIELLRSGRISAIWSTTFPTPQERVEIVQLKMIENQVDPKLYDAGHWETLSRKTDQYVGAELEQIVLRAVKSAWKKRQSVQPSFGELDAAVARVRPVAVLDVENVHAINAFCKDKADPVASPSTGPGGVKTGRGKRSIETDHPENN